ncbi:MAG: helix-turn-helix transcriptional regulator [Spirochaetales bacterium]|nr:helix-turn-helix transcriptional regulator [Spirochaetales bacterium]
MNLIESGKRIASLRKAAGYTQKTLADALSVTDKAVSKWERGICMPDSVILPKLASLLDTDLGTLIPENSRKNEWKGLLILDGSGIPINTMINGKPLIHYLLSYFLLLEITDIAVVTEERAFIDSLNLQQYGFNITYTPFKSKKTMVIYGEFFLFGAYLSKQLQTLMLSNEDTVPCVNGVNLPMMFIHGRYADLDLKKRTAKRKSLFRGTVLIPLSSSENVRDVDSFIRMYEKYHDLNFCDLKEISVCRGITK